MRKPAHYLKAVSVFLAVLTLAFSTHAEDPLDDTAKALGFESFSHYQLCRDRCLKLLNQHVTAADRSASCGKDLRCLQREAARMAEQLKSLARSRAWQKYQCDIVAKIEVGTSGKTSSHGPRYEIEVSRDDQLFVINGEVFEAQTYCFDMEEGDEVIFLEGSPLGACA
jgi:hypothetical protein